MVDASGEERAGYMSQMGREAFCLELVFHQRLNHRAAEYLLSTMTFKIFFHYTINFKDPG